MKDIKTLIEAKHPLSDIMDEICDDDYPVQEASTDSAWLLVSKDGKTVYRGVVKGKGTGGENLVKGLLLDKFIYSKGLESSVRADAEELGGKVMLVPYNLTKGPRHFKGVGAIS